MALDESGGKANSTDPRTKLTGKKVAATTAKSVALGESGKANSTDHRTKSTGKKVAMAMTGSGKNGSDEGVIVDTRNGNTSAYSQHSTRVRKQPDHFISDESIYGTKRSKQSDTRSPLSPVNMKGDDYHTDCLSDGDESSSDSEYEE